MTITDVPGVRVGHWSDFDGLTGVTVFVPPEPNVAAFEARGAAPGTRETALLAPGMRIEQVQAIVLTGGSAFGLASADGVMRSLEAEGRGHETMFGRVPIVPAAVLFDLGVGDPAARPDAAAGAAAYEAAVDGPVAMGTVGAGVGATVANWRGPDARRKGGVGSVAVRVGEATVGALVVANASGDAFTLEGEPLTGGPHVPGPSPLAARLLEETTLVVIATDLAMTRVDLMRLIVRAHDALAVCFRPAHSRYDGDAVFAVSCGDRSGDLDAAGEAAFGATGRAVEAAIRRARAVAGVPATMGEP